MTLRESHTLSSLVIYSVTYACNEIETSFIILREHLNAYFVYLFITYMPVSLKILIMPISSPLKIRFLYCATTDSKKILLFGWSYSDMFHWKVFEKKYGPVLSNEFYLIRYIQNTISTCNQCKKI